MKNATIILIILNSLPILIYPFVFMASMMGLAAQGTGTQPMLAFTLFLWASLLYPLPWLIALIGSGVCLNRERYKWALWQQMAVFAYLVVVVILLVATLMMEGEGVASDGVSGSWRIAASAFSSAGA